MYNICFYTYVSSIVYLKNKSTGKVYAYLNESVWDSELKKCVCKRKCLGHVDPKTGDIVPNRGQKDKDYATVKSIGISFFLGRVAERIGLRDALKQAFPDDWKLILSCAFYLSSGNTYLGRTKYWSMDNDTPYGKMFNAPVVAELLQKIDQNALFSFFREWRDKFDDSEFYMINTSSVSSHDERVKTIRFNDLPIVMVDPKTEMSITFSSKTDIPVSYNINTKNPKDLAAIRKLETANRWLEYNRVVYVMDRDYCNDPNIDDLFRANHKFLLRAPPEFTFARDSISRVKDRIMDLNNYMMISGDPFFVMSFMNYWKGRKCYVHIYFSTDDAENEFSLFLSLLEECHNELRNNIFVEEHKEFYEKYFIVNETSSGRTVEKNGESIMRYNDVAGFLVLISNTIKSPVKALEYYLRKDHVQSNFEDLRNEKDRGCLKLYLDANYEGRLFIQFLSLILVSEIRGMMKSNALLKGLRYSDVMHEMGNIRKISIPGFKTPFYTNLNNIQAEIMKAFGIDPDLSKH